MRKNPTVCEIRLAHAAAQSLPHPLQSERPLPIRTEPRGELVAEFFLPLALAQPRNRTRGPRKAWMASKERQAVLDAMQTQMRRTGLVQSHPIPGRALVRCIRYSSSEPDSTSGWSKVPVDCLQPSGMRHRNPQLHGSRVSGFLAYQGLGIIRSDSPRDTDVVEWWEPAKRGAGFAVIEVWTGGNSEDATCATT